MIWHLMASQADSDWQLEDFWQKNWQQNKINK